MKLGIVLSVRNHPDFPQPLDQLYAEYIEDGVYADTELGFDHLWINEHHFSSDQFCPSPFVTLAAIATQTRKIRLGTGVLCVPFHNPVRISEDAAVLDIISNGRLDLAVGVGSSPDEYRIFGAPKEEAWRRTWEAVELIQRSWAEDRINFHGEFFHYDDLWQNTKPVQSKVPIWWGGFGPKSMRRAAERGYHVLAGHYPGYDETLESLGKALADHQVAQILNIHIAETREQAWDEAEHGLHWYMNFHRTRHNIPFGMTDEGPLEKLPPAQELRHVEGLMPMPGMPAYIGTPDEVREQLLADAAGRRGRITQFALHFRMPGMRTPEVRRSMELFRREVMPHLPLDR